MHKSLADFPILQCFLFDVIRGSGTTWNRRGWCVSTETTPCVHRMSSSNL